MAKETVPTKEPKNSGLLDGMDDLEKRRKERKAKPADKDKGLDLDRAWG